MKKILLILSLFFSTLFQAQEKSSQNSPEEDYNLFISGGCHIGFWTLIFNQNITLNTLPYNIQIDKLIKKKYALGIGYTHDTYPTRAISYYKSGENTSRHNYRVRFYKFLSDQENVFSIYLGAALGVSYWDTFSPWNANPTSNHYWPTAQFLTGIKLKLTDTFFWQTEFGAGPPYGIQTSIGIKF